MTKSILPAPKFIKLSAKEMYEIRRLLEILSRWCAGPYTDDQLDEIRENPDSLVVDPQMFNCLLHLWKKVEAAVPKLHSGGDFNTESFWPFNEEETDRIIRPGGSRSMNAEKLDKTATVIGDKDNLVSSVNRMIDKVMKICPEWYTDDSVSPDLVCSSIDVKM